MKRIPRRATWALPVCLGILVGCEGEADAPVSGATSHWEEHLQGERLAPGQRLRVQLGARVALDEVRDLHLGFQVLSGTGTAVLRLGDDDPMALDEAGFELHLAGQDPTAWAVEVTAGADGLEFALPMTDTTLAGEAAPTALPEALGQARQALVVDQLQGARFPFTCSDGSQPYHYPGSSYHRPSGGVSNIDDTYALDLNCTSNRDSGREVGAAGPGRVVQRADGNGWILIQHSCNRRWLGQDYTTCYTGYLHMRNLAVAVGANVAAGQRLGTVSDAGADGQIHLHFAAYVGEPGRALGSNNAFIQSVDPGTFLGANYNGLSYGTNINYIYVDDQRSAAPFRFERTGTAGDWRTDAAYGQLGGMSYNTSKTGAADNTGKWHFGNAPATGTWQLWAFIPRNHGTTQNARYRLYVNNQLVATTAVNQLNISDDYVTVGAARAINANTPVRVELDDATGVANTRIAHDKLVLLRKTDVRLTRR